MVTTIDVKKMQKIYPYMLDGVWVFDDDATGLVQEPFVQGTSEMISALVAEKETHDAAEGFVLAFRAGAVGEQPPSDADVVAHWLGEQDGGNWYEAIIGDRCMRGWLCPALFKYFEEAPKTIYVYAEARSDG